MFNALFKLCFGDIFKLNQRDIKVISYHFAALILDNLGGLSKKKHN